jgi:asparagine synthase (glutamine-hydrolysing)
MCGIAAIIAKTPIDDTHIKKMTDTIDYRGPDSNGHTSLFENQVWLGHRRLAIVDLTDSGKQPMSYLNGRYWITYNGEIYNFPELRVELEKLGHKFVTNTDTEVILAAYSEWGKDCLYKFNGMWSFVLIDVYSRKLFAARDRFGVKPLYYWFSPNLGFAFASEIKQFTVLPGWKAELNNQRVYDFLNWALLDHTSETLFQGVYQIRGGEAVEIKLSQLVKPLPLPIFRWYDLKPDQFKGDFYEAAEIFRNLLKDSVSLRLRADVAIGSCLSGGLDSSSIVCLVNELLEENKNIDQLQKTFSACAKEKKFDESDFIEEVVKNKKIEAHYTFPSLDNLFEIMDDLTWIQDEPFCSTSIYAQNIVFRCASEKGVKVILDGQGADEQLAGYHGFFGPRFVGLLKNYRLNSLWQEIKQVEKYHGYKKSFAFIQIINILLPEMLRQIIRRYSGKTSTKPDWLSFNKLKAEPIDPFTKLGAKTDTVRELSYSQIKYTNLPMLLHWEDRNSMVHSVESRLPFLDYRLVEFVLGLPDEYKLSKGITKKVLREGMKEILPSRIQNRMDKMGFVTPEEVWIKENNPDQFRKIIKETLDVSQGIINSNFLQKAERIISGREPFNSLIWRVINFGTWIKKFSIKI